MEIIRDIKVLDDYDVLLVDAYGVFRGGRHVFEGSDKTFKHLIDAGKTVLILSNSTQRSAKAIASYQKKGIEKDVHFNDIITSGEVAVDMIQKQAIPFKGNKVYCFGSMRKELWENSVYELTSMEEADFMYISIPQIQEDVALSLPDYIKQNLFVSDLFDENVYDSLDAAPFLPELEKCKALGLPAFSANPDMTAFEDVKNISIEGIQTGEEGAHHVIRQGTIAKAYADMGMEVVQSGKPYMEVFEYCLEVLKRDHGYTDETLKSAKIGMIGDTLGTDILGAKNATEKLGVNMDGILVLTGVSAGNIAEDIKFNAANDEELKNELQKVFDGAGIVPEVIIEKFYS